MTLPYDQAFLIALAMSLAVEVPVVWLTVRKLYGVSPAALATSRLLASAILATVATLPYVWFVVPRFISYGGLRSAGTELLVTVVEAGIYRLTLRRPWRDCTAVSAAANLASWGVGKVLL